MKILPVEVESLHAVQGPDRRTDRQTEVTKLTVAFRDFLKASKTVSGSN